jgi:hypothetical protein
MAFSSSDALLVLNAERKHRDLLAIEIAPSIELWNWKSNRIIAKVETGSRTQIVSIIGIYVRLGWVEYGNGSQISLYEGVNLRLTGLSICLRI